MLILFRLHVLHEPGLCHVLRGCSGVQRVLEGRQVEEGIVHVLEVYAFTLGIIICLCQHNADRPPHVNLP